MTDRLSYADRVCIEVTVRAASDFVFYAYPHMEPISTQIFELSIISPRIIGAKNGL